MKKRCSPFRQEHAGKKPAVFGFLLLSLFPVHLHALEPESSGVQVLERTARLREAGEIEKAEGEIKKALDFEPANFAYRFELANIYAAQFDLTQSSGAAAQLQSREYLEKAARELEQALMLEPKHIPAHFNLGVVYKKQGRFEEARKHFREVLKLDPNQISALMQIGATYEDQGFFDEAKSVYLEAKELDFYNPHIQLAIEELEKRKEQADQRSPSPAADGFLKLEQLRSPHYQRLLHEEPASAQGRDFRQAIPYLSAWLLEQFMKGRQSKK